MDKNFYLDFFRKTGLEDEDTDVKVKVRKTLKNEVSLDLFCTPSSFGQPERVRPEERFSGDSPVFHVYQEEIESLPLEISNPVPTEILDAEPLADMLSAASLDQLMESISENNSPIRWTDNFEWEDKIQQLNREVFHNQSFKNPQREIINAILSRKDVFAFLPTGAGKSLTYQLSSLLLDGVTIVIYPIIALINDQIEKMSRYNITTMGLDSENLEDTRINNVFYRVIGGSVKVLCITPERLNNPGIRDLIKNLHVQKKINFFVIDEAHCILNWGRDFRADFSKLGFLKEEYPDIPLVCLTGSISKPDMDSTIELLGMRPEIFKANLNRPNLKYSVIPRTGKGYDQLIKLIKTRFMNQTGIVFYNSKKKCETLAKKFKENLIFCEYYHADLTAEAKKQIASMWQEGVIKIIIATSAFGMGIDNLSTKFIIHYKMPKSLSEYYQESGRCGRDGSLSECIIMYSLFDRQSLNYFIKDYGENRKIVALNEIYNVLEYCEEKNICRRLMILKYFDEELVEPCNGRCDNCLNANSSDQRDFTHEAMRLTEVVSRNSLNFTIKQLSENCRGKKGANNELSRIFHSLSSVEVNRIIIRLLLLDVLKEKLVPIGGGGYSGYLELGCNANKLGISIEVILNREIYNFANARAEPEIEYIEISDDESVEIIELPYKRKKKNDTLN